MSKIRYFSYTRPLDAIYNIFLMKVIALISTVLIICGTPQSDFHGTISIDKYSDDRLIGEEIYYFGNNKLRKDIKTFYLDTTLLTTEIYLFKEDPNFVFVNRNGSFTRSPYKGLDNFENYEVKNRKPVSICGIKCDEKLFKATKQWGLESKIETIQQIWCANELSYHIPNDCKIPEGIISKYNFRIALKMIESGETEHGKRYNITRLAKNVKRKLTPDSLFIVN